jgi:hypothetical protein
MQPGLGGPGGMSRISATSVSGRSVEVQDHHRPLIDWQAPELAAEPIALDHVRGEVGGGRMFLVGHEVTSAISRRRFPSPTGSRR